MNQNSRQITTFAVMTKKMRHFELFFNRHVHMVYIAMPLTENPRPVVVWLIKLNGQMVKKVSDFIDFGPKSHHIWGIPKKNKKGQ